MKVKIVDNMFYININSPYPELIFMDCRQLLLSDTFNTI